MILFQYRFFLLSSVSARYRRERRLFCRTGKSDVRRKVIIWSSEERRRKKRGCKVLKQTSVRFSLCVNFASPSFRPLPLPPLSQPESRNRCSVFIRKVFIDTGRDRHLALLPLNCFYLFSFRFFRRSLRAFLISEVK